MKLHRRSAFVLAAVLALGAACSKKNQKAAVAFPDSLVADEVIVTVNSEPIVGRQLMVLAYISTSELGDSTRSPSFNLRLLDQMIDRALFIQEAQAAGTTVPDSLVQQLMGQFVNQFGGEERIDGMLATVGLTREDFKDSFRRDLTIRSYVQSGIEPTIQVSDTDSRAFFDQNPQMFVGQDSVRARHIIFLSKPDDTDEIRKNRRSQLAGIRQRILKGEDFSALARQYSQDGAAQNGGDLGYFPRGMMVQPFSDAAFALKKGQVSDIVETQFGMHLIKCVDKKAARDMTFEDAKPRIASMLRQRALGSELQNRLKKNRDTAIIVRNYEQAGA